ncbi:MAG: hypothetical protein V3S69_03650 [Dehalococcoidales bacterium]
MTISKPMLSATVHGCDLDGMIWPLLGSPKLDGIRVLNHPTLGPVTRSFKPVPNVFIRDTLAELLMETPLDGELLALNKDGLVDFNSTQSAVMTRGGQPSFLYAVFDCFAKPEDPFSLRFADAVCHVNVIDSDHVDIVEHTIIKDPEEFANVAHEHLAQGYEGTMLRDPEGPYKSGRSTLRQQWLVKYKEWADAEGTIIGFEERMHNANEDIKDNFGYAKRTSHIANLIPEGTLGALVLDTAWGELRVGTGFDDAQRKEIWDRNMIKYERYIEDPAQPELVVERFVVRGIQPDIGRKVTFKYQAYGMQDKPRFPVFLHFREDE